LECAPGAGQVEVSDLTGVLGFRKMKAMARQQRSHSIEFKRQVVQEYIAGETLYGLAKRHDLSRQLIRVWIEKYETGGLDADAQAAELLHEYKTKIAALERMVGRQALEIDFLKGALKNRTAAAKRDHLRHCRPDGVSIAEGCRLMGIARSTFYDRPAAGADDATVVAQMKSIATSSKPMAIGVLMLSFVIVALW
jgi:transposase